MDSEVVILAGGQGQRIGGAKSGRLLGGRTLLDRAIEIARRWSPRPALCLRSRDQIAACPIEVIVDDPDLEGPLGGLAAALRFAREQKLERLLTLPCDAPFLPEDLLARLGSVLDGNDAAVPSTRGQLHPACALWTTRALDALPAYAASGRRSLHGFAEHVGYVEVPWPEGASDPFFNINTEEDLARAEALLAKQGQAGA